MEKASASMWRKIDSRYNLVGSECKNCKAVYFPSRIVCKSCGRETKMEGRRFSGEGEVYSYTKIHVPAEAFRDSAPYTIAVVKLVEGPMVEGHIVETGRKAEIGTKVKMVFRKMYTEDDQGLIHYHFKFEPV